MSLLHDIVKCPFIIDPEMCPNTPSHSHRILFSEYSSRQLVPIPPPPVNVGGRTSQTGFSVTTLSSGF